MFYLLAQTAARGSTGQAIFLQFVPLIFIFFLFYLLFIRPQMKRQKEHQAMVSALKKGDEVVTQGGFFASVIGVKDDAVVLRLGDSDTKVECLKSAVATLRKKA